MKNYRYLLFMLFGASFAFNPAHAADQNELDSDFLMVLQDAVGLQAEQANQDDFLDFSDEIDCDTPPTTTTDETFLNAATTQDSNTATISQSDPLKTLLEAQFNQTLEETKDTQAVLEQAATSDNAQQKKSQQKKPGLKRKKQGKPTTNKKKVTDRLEKAELSTSSNTNTVTQQTSAAVVASVSRPKNSISFKRLSKKDEEEAITSQRPHKCPFEGCSAVFARGDTLTVHTRTHTGEKPFKCTFEGCNAAFIQNSNLTKHTRTHTGEKSFKCAFEGCNAAFTQNSNLIAHTRTHTGEKPFKCTFEGCSAAFSQVATLNTHTRIHTGEKPFKCTFEGCGACFAVRCHLTKHTRTHANALKLAKGGSNV